MVRIINDGEEKTVYLYNIKDHQDCYKEVQSQAISYTTDVPAMIGTKMMLEEKWKKTGMWNTKQFDPDPFLEDMNQYGLAWKVIKLDDFKLD